VQLKSGGPRTTVEKIEGDRVTCVWFEGKKKFQRETFALGNLRKWVPPPAGFKMIR